MNNNYRFLIIIDKITIKKAKLTYLFLFFQILIWKKKTIRTFVQNPY